jgi:hypothetical protein
VREAQTTITRNNLQDGHEGNIPEFLASNNVKTAGFEFLVLGAVGVAEDDEYPSAEETEPSDETMMTFKYAKHYKTSRKR